MKVRYNIEYKEPQDWFTILEYKFTNPEMYKMGKDIKYMMETFPEEVLFCTNDKYYLAVVFYDESQYLWKLVLIIEIDDDLYQNDPNCLITNLPPEIYNIVKGKIEESIKVGV